MSLSTNKTVAIVSGSNKGIGYAIVKQLCQKFQGDVLLTARDVERGKASVKALEAKGLRPIFHQLDIESLDSIEALKKFVVDKYSGVDILVNNAGIAFGFRDKTTPSLSQDIVTINTNFTGTLNMLRAFTPVLKPHGRIVNVASSIGLISHLNSQELRDKMTYPNLSVETLESLMQQYIADRKEGSHVERGWAEKSYTNSKAAMLALSNIYARQMEESRVEDVIVSACCPGWVKTDLTPDEAPLTPDQGAETPVMLALLPPGSPNGKFWMDKTISSLA